MSKYDDASWHLGADFPTELPEKNGATHTGMFLTWCANNNLISDELQNTAEIELDQLKKQLITGAELIMEVMDGKFSADDLNETGNAFAKDYYVDETDFAEKYSSFASDYVNLFDDLAEEKDFEYETFYHIEDSWENYDLMMQVIDYRFEEWKEYRNNIH